MQQAAFKALPPGLRDMQERRMIHRAWNAWLAQADDAELEQYRTLRNAFAPGQPCSSIRLIRACLENPCLADQLPKTLTQLLRDADLLPSYENG